MKRGAERQISKDDFDKDEVSDDSTQVGFQKADDAILATRPIRGLPKRASVATVPVLAPQTSSTNFLGFSGFGGGSSSFSTATTTSATTPLSSFTPALATQTNTAKSLTSLLASAHNPPAPTLPSENLKPSSLSLSTSPFSTPATAPATVSPSSAKKDENVDPAELKYYTSIRGLNESLRATVGKAIDDDPFIDIIVFLERYKYLRAEIYKDFNGNAAPPPSSTAAAPTPVPITKAFTMPAAPKDGFIFGNKNVTTSTDTKLTSSTNTGFIPTLPSTTAGFGAFSDKIKNTGAPAASPFSFSAKPAETVATTSTTSLFSLKPAEATKDQSSSPSFNPFASPKPPAPIDFGSKHSTTTSVSPSFTFGSGSSSNFNVTAPSTRISTGDCNASSTSRFAGFAGFTKTTTTSAGFGLSTIPSAPQSSPSLGLDPIPTSSTRTATISVSASSGDTGEAAADDAPKRSIAESFALNADNKHDQEGAGEEDEETMHAVKLKAYVMKDDKGAKSWAEMGYGVLRIKKHKETSSRRVLLRSSSTGQILINFNFHSAFKPTQKGKNVTFLGHDAEGNSKMYTLKLQTQEQATSLADAFDREVKAKEGFS